MDVPAPLTRFVGRAADLAALVEAIDRARWVAVVGPPGVGKTRLVGELVRDREGFGDVAWVDLAGAAVVDDAAAAIAAEVGAAAGAGTLIERVARALAGRGPALLVLDEVEALGDALPAVVGVLTAGAPALRVVTTSRRRSGAGEACFDLGALVLADAVELFADRARAAQRGFAVEPWRADITRLVDALDRLPIAIELAAARTRVMTPAQLVERPSLVFGEPGRDRLRAALASTWDGLAAEQRAALAQLAVFRGGFDLDAATAVVELAAGARVVADVLASLCDVSVVAARPAGSELRFEVLSIVRELLRDRLADDGARDRHARYFVALANRLVAALDGPDAERARDGLLRERANLLAVVERGRGAAGDEARHDALAATIAIAAAQIRAGSYRELSELIAASLERVDEARCPAACAEAWWLRGEALRQAGWLDEAARCYEHVQRIGERTGDAAILGRAGYGAGAIAFSRGELATAVALYRTRVVELPGEPDPTVLTRALSDQGVIQTVLGEIDEAREAFARALRVARATSCVTGEGRALVGLGQLAQQAGRLEEARRTLEQALAIHERVGDQRSIAYAHHLLGLNHHLARRLEAATERYHRALAITDQLGHRLLGAIVLAALGSCAQAAGRIDEAVRHLEQAASAFEQLGHASYRAVALARLATALADRGALDAARSLLATVHAIVPADADREVSDGIAACSAHVELAAGGDAGEARAHLARARAGAVDVRIQALALARRLEGWTPTRRRLVVGSHARWFVLDERERVGLERRGPPSRILAALADHRAAAPGRVVGPDALFEAGWPGQRASSESAAQRVYTAIWTLRKLGLRDVIVRVADGYFLDPEIDLVTDDAVR